MKTEINPGIWHRLAYTNDFDLRYDVIIKVLDELQIRVRRVVDLNAGTSRILKHVINHSFIYYANDLCEEYNKQALLYANVFNHEVGSCVKLYSVDDVNFVSVISDVSIDVLLSLGHGAGEYHDGPESKTQTDSFKKIVLHNQPKVVVYENIEKYEKDYGVIAKMEQWLQENKYKKKKHVFIDYFPGSASIADKRHLLFFESNKVVKLNESDNL